MKPITRYRIELYENGRWKTFIDSESESPMVFESWSVASKFSDAQSWGRDFSMSWRIVEYDFFPED